MSKSRNSKPAIKAVTSAIALTAMMGAGAMPAAAATHTVSGGDTLSGIAAKHGVSLQSVFSANSMGMSTVIFPGQQITVDETVAAPKPKPGPATATAHTVVPGDTLSGIAGRYGVSLQSVFTANSMGMSTVIFPGQQIAIGNAPAAPVKTVQPAPVAAPAPAAPAAGSYRVVSGDTMTAISARHGVSLSALLQCNGMQASAVIYVGQRINLPTAAPAPVPATTAPTPPASSASLKDLVRSTAEAMGVDPVLALAIAQQESGFRQHVVSSAGAVGTMQVMPSSGIWASELVGRPLDLNRADENVTAGVAIISALVRTSPTLEDAIASYYQGQYSVQTIGYYDDTKVYVASVLGRMASFR